MTGQSKENLAGGSLKYQFVYLKLNPWWLRDSQFQEPPCIYIIHISYTIYIYYTHIISYTIYITYYILYTIYYILYTIYYILYTIYYILYTIYYTVSYTYIYIYIVIFIINLFIINNHILFIHVFNLSCRGYVQVVGGNFFCADIMARRCVEAGTQVLKTGWSTSDCSLKNGGFTVLAHNFNTLTIVWLDLEGPGMVIW